MKRHAVESSKTKSSSPVRKALVLFAVLALSLGSMGVAQGFNFAGKNFGGGGDMVVTPMGVSYIWAE